jgi:nitroreductase
MDFWSVIEQRHSVRTFASSPVSDESVERILEAGIRAPSAGNRQPWHFVIVRSPAVKSSLKQAAFGQSFVSEAPVVIVVCAEPEQSGAVYRDRGRALYCLQDTAAAVENMLLAATALGLGACWVGAFDEGAAASAVTLPAGFRPVALIPLGVPARVPPGTPRRDLAEVSSRID